MTETKKEIQNLVLYFEEKIEAIHAEINYLQSKIDNLKGRREYLDKQITSLQLKEAVKLKEVI